MIIPQLKSLILRDFVAHPAAIPLATAELMEDIDDDILIFHPDNIFQSDKTTDDHRSSVGHRSMASTNRSMIYLRGLNCRNIWSHWTTCHRSCCRGLGQQPRLSTLYLCSSRTSLASCWRFHQMMIWLSGRLTTPPTSQSAEAFNKFLAIFDYSATRVA